ncbi:MAG TPA: hypothetical protein VKU00_17905 [Chthonomonadaceae bacterium]|nr:hypothetical protein [Chthonomonadaceae bacterium]
MTEEEKQARIQEIESKAKQSGGMTVEEFNEIQRLRGQHLKQPSVLDDLLSKKPDSILITGYGKPVSTRKPS